MSETPTESASAPPANAPAKEKKPLSPRRRATRRIFLRLCGAALATALAVPVEAHYIEPLAVQVTEHDVYLHDLLPEHEGLKIAHLSDLHRGPYTPDRVINEAVRLAMRHQPDLAVVTGDFIEHGGADAEPVSKMLAALTARLGVWGCLGNHDYADYTGDTVADALAKHSGVKLLRNQAEPILPGLWIAGIEDLLQGKPDRAAALAPIPTGVAALVLAHVPTQIYPLSPHPYLVLSGHTHGGQVLVPGLAPHLPRGTEGFPVASGWGRWDRAQLFVSRGVGMTGLPVRFRCRPEVAIITLRRGDLPPHTRPALPARAMKKAARVARNAWHDIKSQA